MVCSRTNETGIKNNSMKNNKNKNMKITYNQRLHQIAATSAAPGEAIR